MGRSPLPSGPRGLGSVVSSPSRGRSGAPATDEFSKFWSLQNASVDTRKQLLAIFKIWQKDVRPKSTGVNVPIAPRESAPMLVCT